MKTLLKCAVVLGGVAFLVLGLLIFLQLGGFKNALPGVADGQVALPDFLGVIEEVAAGEEWPSQADVAGQDLTQVGVGPGIIVLSDGTELEVPRNTTLQGTCNGFPHTRPVAPNRGCFVFGDLEDDGTVESLVATEIGIRDDKLLQIGLSDVRGTQLLVGPSRGRNGNPVVGLPLGDDAVLEGCAQRGPVVVADGEISLPDTSNEGYLIAFDRHTLRVQVLVCTI